MKANVLYKLPGLIILDSQDNVGISADHVEEGLLQVPV